MTNINSNPAPTDIEIRGSLLEMDLPGAPRPAANPAPTEAPAIPAVKISAMVVRPAAQVAAVSAAQIQAAMTQGDLIAGAAAEGDGAIVGWNGLGELTRAQIAEILTAADASAWMPESRTATAQGAQAVSVVGGSFVVRAVRAPKASATRTATAEERGWVARWQIVASTDGGTLGDSFGTVVAVASISADGAMTVEGNEEIATAIRAEYARITGAEIFRANDITKWFSSNLIAVGSVRFGVGYYIPASARAIAERVLAHLSPVWGTDWIVPAVPMATSAQLRAGLAKGLSAEVTAVLSDLDRQRNLARKNGNSDVGSRSAATLLRDLRAVADRAASYETLLGSCVSSVRADIAAAIATIEPLLGDTALRGEALEMV